MCTYRRPSINKKLKSNCKTRVGFRLDWFYSGLLVMYMLTLSVTSGAALGSSMQILSHPADSKNTVMRGAAFWELQEAVMLIWCGRSFCVHWQNNFIMHLKILRKFDQAQKVLNAFSSYHLNLFMIVPTVYSVILMNILHNNIVRIAYNLLNKLSIFRYSHSFSTFLNLVSSAALIRSALRLQVMTNLVLLTIYCCQNMSITVRTHNI